MGFRAPLDEIAFTLRHIANLDEVLVTRDNDDLSAETIDAVLAEAGRFAEGRLEPMDIAGDRVGCHLKDGNVTTPPGWREAYRDWMDAGWNGIGARTEWGGQNLPVMVQIAVQELWNSGSPAFAVGPMLTAGGIEALDAHASAEIKARYLPRLVSGEWMATMNLTEPQAGSDLSAIRTRAERIEDGSYRIFGQKIFITYGEHDLTENIIHLVLARLPDAPDGTGGISLFLVPKFLLDDDGTTGRQNDLVCAGLEEKLGLHGSPTCLMAYGESGEGAIGWLVGEENRGLAAMFTMMNLARLNVGIQGIGVAARAYDRARSYAQERRQGRSPDAARGTSSPIIEHPDVQRDLLRMKSLTAAPRAIAYTCAHAIDMSRQGSPEDRRWWADRANLLTPVAKAFSSDAGTEVASIGIQVHGGAGYIEETGAARSLRDARIFQIYEGTNGIQAIDLVIRKLPLSKGATVQRLIDDLGKVAKAVAATNRDDFGRMGVRLISAVEHLDTTTRFLADALAKNHLTLALAGATPYLKLFGLTAGGVYLAKGALFAAASNEDQGWISLARFFADNFIGETTALAATVMEGGESLSSAARDHLGVNPGQG